MAPTLNLTIDQGSRFERQIRRRNVDGTLVDMTGWTARGHMRRRMTDDDPLVTFHFELQPVGDDENRQFAMWLTPLETASIAAGPYYYDVELVPNGDEALVSRVLQGIAQVTAEVTRG